MSLGRILKKFYVLAMVWNEKTMNNTPTTQGKIQVAQNINDAWRALIRAEKLNSSPQGEGGIMTDEQRTWEEAEKLFHESVSEMKKIYERLGIDSKTNGLFWADAELKRLRAEINRFAEDLLELVALRADNARLREEIDKLILARDAWIKIMSLSDDPV